MAAIIVMRQCKTSLNLVPEKGIEDVMSYACRHTHWHLLNTYIYVYICIYICVPPKDDKEPSNNATIVMPIAKTNLQLGLFSVTSLISNFRFERS
jgi:hypothetical protein